MIDGPNRTSHDQDGLTIRCLASTEDFNQAVALFCEVWSADSAIDLVNASTLRALSMSDNYVSATYLDGEMVGAAFAFRGDSHLHSHLVGVSPKLQSRGYGTRLKDHQLTWALSRGLESVRWTLDPLVRRNAYFSIRKLGASVLSYEENLYGELCDGINTGEETDRLVVEWVAADRHPSRRPPPAAVLLGRPVPCDDEIHGSGPLVWSLDESAGLLIIPSDIEALRATDRKRALWWRTAVRDAFAEADARAYEVVGVTADGCYAFRPRC
jgi:predicted GNAT superfamily acetyltransferase